MTPDGELEALRRRLRETEGQLRVTEQQLRETEAVLHEKTEDLALMRIHLDALALVDGITGLFNANGIQASIQTALQRLDRMLEPFTVTAIRIPALHDAIAVYPGEIGSMLRHVTAMVRAGIRRLDAAGRMHDDTFVVVAPLTGGGDPASSVKRLTTLVRAAPVRAGERDIDLDPRIAIVVAQPGAIMKADAIMEMALDAAEQATPDNPIVMNA